MGNRDYYIKPEFSKELEAYKTFIKDIATYLGADSKTAVEDVKAIIDFETYMAQVWHKYCEIEWLEDLVGYRINEMLMGNIPWPVRVNIKGKKQ